MANDRASGPRPAPRWWPLPVGPSVVFVVACAAGVLAAGIVLALGKGAAPAPRIIRARVLGAAREHRARATVRIRGTRARLLFARLPAPGAGRVFEVWVEHRSAAPLPAGLFAARRGSVTLSSPVRRGDRVLVTVEPRRGSSVLTGAPLLEAGV